MSALSIDAKSRGKFLERTAANVVGFQKATQARKFYLDVFVHQAFNLARIDQGKFLAGLIYCIWVANKGSFKNIKSMKSRKLYKQGFLGKVGKTKPWRKWISEDLLKRFNDPAAKQIVKSLLE